MATLAKTTAKFSKIGDGIEMMLDGDKHVLLRVALTGGEPSKSGKSMLTANSHGWGPLTPNTKYSLMVSREK